MAGVSACGVSPALPGGLGSVPGTVRGGVRVQSDRSPGGRAEFGEEKLL